jgi:hypothetical protein
MSSPSQEERKNWQKKLFSYSTTAHESKPKSWRTQTGKTVRDDEETITIKFNAWYVVKNGEEDIPSHSHFTTRYGRGPDKVVYTEYGRGEYIGKVDLPENFIDRRDPSSSPKPITHHPYSQLRVQYLSPSDHAQKMVGRLRPDTNQFYHNARESIRVSISKHQFQKLRERLDKIEENAYYFLFLEVPEIEGRETAKCYTPLFILAQILDEKFSFSKEVSSTRGFIREFANHFPDITSPVAYREYSEAEYYEKDSMIRRRIDKAAETSNRRVIKFNAPGYNFR